MATRSPDGIPHWTRCSALEPSAGGQCHLDEGHGGFRTEHVCIYLSETERDNVGPKAEVVRWW